MRIGGFHMLECAIFHCKYAYSTDYEQYSRYHEHFTLSVSNSLEYNTSTCGCNNLGNADSAVDESALNSHVSISFEGIGDDGKR